jgi:hypothetical protein
MVKNKKAMGAFRLTHGLRSKVPDSEAWVNPPKGKKEKVSVESGHHVLCIYF